MPELPFGPTSKRQRSTDKGNLDEVEEVKTPEFERLKFGEVDPRALEESQKIVVPLEEFRAHLDDVADAIFDASFHEVSEPEEFREIQYRLRRAKDMSQRELERAKAETEDAPEISETVEPKLERATSKLEEKVEEAERLLRGRDFEEASSVAEVDITEMVGDLDTLIDPLKTNSYLKRESSGRKGKGVYYIPF